MDASLFDALQARLEDAPDVLTDEHVGCASAAAAAAHGRPVGPPAEPGPAAAELPVSSSPRVVGAAEDEDSDTDRGDDTIAEAARTALDALVQRHAAVRRRATEAAQEASRARARAEAAERQNAALSSALHEMRCESRRREAQLVAELEELRERHVAVSTLLAERTFTEETMQLAVSKARHAAEEAKAETAETIRALAAVCEAEAASEPKTPSSAKRILQGVIKWGSGRRGGKLQSEEAAGGDEGEGDEGEGDGADEQRDEQAGQEQEDGEVEAGGDAL